MGALLLFFSVFCVSFLFLDNREDKGSRKAQASEFFPDKKKASADFAVSSSDSIKDTDSAPDSTFLSFLQATTFYREEEVEKLFFVGQENHPLVKTITYEKHAPWLEGREASIADYSAHYRTSSAFILRSLDEEVDGFRTKIAPGTKFNVLAPQKEIEFHLLIDLSRSKLLFYYLDKQQNTKMLLKTYDVGVGRKDPSKKSGCLTPLGTYRIGKYVAVYAPGIKGYVDGKKVEMMQVFGTRWAPLQKQSVAEKQGNKLFAIHGSPWSLQKNGVCAEDLSYSNEHKTDGSISLVSSDIEEIFPIITSRDTFVHIVKDTFFLSDSVEKK